MRGDANGDGLLNIADPVTIIMYFVGAGNLNCRDAANANNDSSIDVPDAAYLLHYTLSGGPAPPQPFPGCGADTDASLGCKADDFCAAGA